MTIYISPQSASSPITTNLRKDELAALQAVDDNATSRQRAIQTGNSIPLVFCSYMPENAIGGVWLAPPAVRIGAQYKESDISSFSYGLVLGDGEMPSIALADIQQGASALTSLLSPSAVTTYNGLAVSGFDYTLTYETAGSPQVGTPGRYQLSAAAYFRPDTYDSLYYGIYNPPYEGNLFTNLATISSGSAGVVDGEYRIILGTDIGKVFYFEIIAEDLNNPGVPAAASIRFEINQAVVQSRSISDPAPSGAYKLATNINQDLPTSGSSVAAYIDVLGYEQATGSQLRIAFRYNYVKWIYIPASADYLPGEPAVSTNLPLFPGSGGTFEGLTTLAVKGGYVAGVENSNLYQQVRCFVRSGIVVNKLLGGSGSSNLFPDLSYYLLQKAGVAANAFIDLPSFQLAAEFNQNSLLTFNGVLANSANLRDYLASVAPYYLLRFVQAGGKYMMLPVLPLNADKLVSADPVVPVATFNNENIVVGSYQKEYASTEQLRPFCAVMTWREQSAASFPVSRALEVRFDGTALDGPYEQYDMEEFCTDVRHAEIIGRYIISSRKNIKHYVTFKTTSASASLLPSQIIEVTWSYEAQGVQQQTTDFYQIDNVVEDQLGNYQIEATHFPTDVSGRSIISADMQPALTSPPPETEVPGDGPSAFAWSYTPTAADVTALLGGEFKFFVDASNLYYVEINSVDSIGVDRYSDLSAIAVNDTIRFSYNGGGNEISQTVSSVQFDVSGAWVRFGIPDNLFSVFADGQYVTITSVSSAPLGTRFSFENGEAQLGVQDNTTRSITRAFDGAYSAVTPATQEVGLLFTNAFPYHDKPYYMWSTRFYYNSPSILSTGTLTIAGQRETFARVSTNGIGWQLRGVRVSSSEMSFRVVAGEIAIDLIGTATVPVQSWVHAYVQVYWLNGTDNIPTISLWIDGSLVGTSPGGITYNPPTNKKDFQTRGFTKTSDASTFYDYCLAATDDAPLVPMSQATVDPIVIEKDLAIIAQVQPRLIDSFRFTKGNGSTSGTWDAQSAAPSLNYNISFTDADAKDVDTAFNAYVAVPGKIVKISSNGDPFATYQSLSITRNPFGQYWTITVPQADVPPGTVLSGELLVEIY